MTRWAGASGVTRLSAYLQARRPRNWPRALLTALGYAAGWAAIAVPVAYHAFMTDSRSTVVVGHDAVVSPTRDGWATIDLGAFLPDVRYPTDRDFGVLIDVGATNLDDYNAIIERYAVIASQPEGEIDKVSELVRDMAYDAIVTGAAIGLAGPVLWLIVGRRRRHHLAHALTVRRSIAIVAVGGVVIGLSASQLFDDHRPSASVAATSEWQPISELLPETPIEGEAARLEIQGGLVTSGTRRLIQSAFDTYRTSLTFYQDLVDRAPALADKLRQPADDETVAIFVTDRHDNVGMDPVSRAVADAGGGTILFDGGDDTSTGEAWEAFSLDSVAKAYDDFDGKYGVAGNHDNGAFVSDYLSDLGFTMLAGEPVKATDGIRLLGAPDPRSSGLGSWRTVAGVTLQERGADLADVACAADRDGDRVSTLLVHDVTLGHEALSRGCVDLVLAGHLHLQVGPTAVTSTDGHVGATYTNGTTGGAAYAFALGSKLRRDAEVTLVTYRDGRAIGLQPVSIRTNGTYEVERYAALPRNGGEAAGD